MHGIERRLKALEKKHPSKTDTVTVIYLCDHTRDPGGAWCVTGGKWVPLTREEGESAEAFCARCDTVVNNGRVQSPTNEI